MCIAKVSVSACQTVEVFRLSFLASTDICICGHQVPGKSGSNRNKLLHFNGFDPLDKPRCAIKQKLLVAV